uniref:Uncharacterized protein n=1 Tax=Anguilla anguilla TaxID=7936 RepID=A0A0E9RPK9_ANGAN
MQRTLPILHAHGFQNNLIQTITKRSEYVEPSFG